MAPQGVSKSTFDISEDQRGPKELEKCIAELHAGDWQFIQLRGTTFDASCVDSDEDVDLLGSRESVEALLTTVFQWVRAARCHARVMARRPSKLQLRLFSLDGRHQACFDLWISLGQIDGGRSALTYEGCIAAATTVSNAIRRFPVGLEASVYVHHLICKKKDLSSDRVQHRMQVYTEGCRQAGLFELADQLHSIAETQCISPECEAATLATISAQTTLQTSHWYSSIFRTLGKLRGELLSAPRKSTIVSVIGCDGAGKTTLANLVQGRMPEVDQVRTGKHLYRKSLTYKLAVIFIRPLMFRDREKFDEQLAPFTYLRASAALRLLLLRQRRGVMTLIDRSLLDFLYTRRKTDTPRFSGSRWLADFFGCRIPTVHCIVSHSRVMERKQEVTERGHLCYDDEMFARHVRQCPTDYTAFNNDSSLAQSAEALQETLRALKRAA